MQCDEAAVIGNMVRFINRGLINKKHIVGVITGDANSACHSLWCGSLKGRNRKMFQRGPKRAIGPLIGFEAEVIAYVASPKFLHSEHGLLGDLGHLKIVMLKPGLRAVNA